ncbi:MAG: oligoribonuclease [Myxococcota bacterium]|nr:oligoribonuclease [Myxococcota bacterium]
MRALRMVWMDLEMTGLDPERESIIEMATLVTEADLSLVAEGPSLVIHQDEALLARMDEWNTEHHTASGLLEKVRQSTVQTRDAELATLDFLSQHVDLGKAPLCGNSIWQDRRFLCREMAELNAYLHYRLIDVSSLKELARRWYPEHVYHKNSVHRALDDIHESIAELRHYRQLLFRA